VLRAGGDGYIMKQEDPEEIIHAIRDVLVDTPMVSEQVMASRSTISQERRSKAKTRSLEKAHGLGDRDPGIAWPGAKKQPGNRPPTPFKCCIPLHSLHTDPKKAELEVLNA